MFFVSLEAEPLRMRYQAEPGNEGKQLIIDDCLLTIKKDSVKKNINY